MNDITYEVGDVEDGVVGGDSAVNDELTLAGNLASLL